MCWNNTNNSENVMGESGRINNCRCHCRCNCDNDNVAGEAVRIALRGPGCINGTGRCLNETFVESERGSRSICGQVSPCGNVQL